jgi:cell division protein FtsW
LVLLYIILLFRAGYIARKSSSPRAALLVMGSALMLVTQAMLHMMVSVGLFPVTGQPLPLISKGGTSILINCFYMAVILSVSRTVDEERAAQVGVQQLPVEQQAAEGR